jgi:hypothetical protein
MSGSDERHAEIVREAWRANTKVHATPISFFKERTMEQHIKPVFEFSEDTFSAEQRKASEHYEWLVDQALMDTFPASDPVSLCAID